ncbi:TetR family transcriptional regulator [Conexibacter sp. W3-3-2]|nr:TetR family transcriptional regulator [Conexibacter sp. W3-3-2]
MRAVNPDEPPPRPLPRGRHSPGGEVVASSQRTRLLDALVELVAEHGYAGVKVGEIARTAGVSLSTFYAHFPGKEECFLEAYESVVQALMTDLGRSLAQVTTLEDGIEQAAVAYFAWFAGRPTAARTFLIEIRGAGNVALQRRAEALDQFLVVFAAALERVGRADLPPPRARLLALLGAVEALAYDRVLAGHPEQLLDLAPDAVDAAMRLLAP